MTAVRLTYQSSIRGRRGQEKNSPTTLEITKHPVKKDIAADFPVVTVLYRLWNRMEPGEAARNVPDLTAGIGELPQDVLRFRGAS